jgi:predicted ATP-binding protein involved in virulence
MPDNRKKHTPLSQSEHEFSRLDKIAADNILPNCLSRIYIKNFQGIKELTIEKLPLDCRWIFLTGENAFGKTSILRAIAKGLVGDELLVRNSLTNSSIISSNGVSNQQAFSIWGQGSTDTKYFGIGGGPPPVATYGVARFQLSANNQEASDRSKQKTYSLFHDDGQLINIEQELIIKNAYDPPRFEALKQVILQIIPNLRDIKIEIENNNPRVRYCEQNDEKQAYDYISLNELAAGYRSILTMVGDMVLRLSDGSKPLNETAGIVLIDEIDAHLHPKYQYELPNLLSKVFPKVQFIVTTHSPIPILGLPEDNKPVILTVERSPEQGITVDRKDDDFDIRQLTPLTMLTSPIFGFQTLFARGAKVENIIASDNFEDVAKIDKIKQRLKALREQGSIK